MEDSIECSVRMQCNKVTLRYFSLFSMYICMTFVLGVVESSPLGQEIKDDLWEI